MLVCAFFSPSFAVVEARGRVHAVLRGHAVRTYMVLPTAAAGRRWLGVCAVCCVAYNRLCMHACTRLWGRVCWCVFFALSQVLKLRLEGEFMLYCACVPYCIVPDARARHACVHTALGLCVGVRCLFSVICDLRKKNRDKYSGNVYIKALPRWTEIYGRFFVCNLII